MLKYDRLDITFKAASQAWETLADTKTRLSYEPADAAFSRAFPEDGTLWKLLERDSYSRERFDREMEFTAKSQPPDAIFKGMYAAVFRLYSEINSKIIAMTSVRLAGSSGEL